MAQPCGAPPATSFHRTHRKTPAARLESSGFRLQGRPRTAAQRRTGQPVRMHRGPGSDEGLSLGGNGARRRTRAQQGPEKKGAARVRPERPKSREETPKEGSDTARRCRALTIWARRERATRQATADILCTPAFSSRLENQPLAVPSLTQRAPTRLRLPADAPTGGRCTPLRRGQGPVIRPLRRTSPPVLARTDGFCAQRFPPLARRVTTRRDARHAPRNPE